MTAPACPELTLAVLEAYASGDMPATEAAAVEAHLFVCPACAERTAEFEALAGAVSAAVRSGTVGGFTSDDVLNRLAREGVRVRTYALSPGDVVPCAVWQGDELMVVRLRGDFRAGDEVTLARHVAGVEVSRVTAPVLSGPRDEVLYADPAGSIGDLPAGHVDIIATTREGDVDRVVGTYRLIHGGSFHR